MKKIIITILMLVLFSCGSRKVQKEDTVSMIKEKEVLSKIEEVKIYANNDIIENMSYLSHNFQADSIVVTKEGTKYYNPRSIKEELSQEKKENKQYVFSNVKSETLDLQREFFKSYKTKVVEKVQVNYFKMIFQFWPLLLLLALAYLIYRYWSRLKGLI